MPKRNKNFTLQVQSVSQNEIQAEGVLFQTKDEFKIESQTKLYGLQEEDFHDAFEPRRDTRTTVYIPKGTISKSLMVRFKYEIYYFF